MDSNDTAIVVERLSKKYILEDQRPSYSLLRDEISSVVKGLFEKKDRSHSKEVFWALKDVSFKVKKGEAVGIIGANGAGKSTLLKILSRITNPTSGTARLYGRVSSLLEIGTGFNPELTGRENIFLNGTILGMKRSEIRSKFNEILDFAEIGKFIDTPVKFYSSGMRVRLAFAVAAHLDPDILLVDEVLAVGDIYFQKKSLNKMNEIVGQEGRTIVFVSHSTDAIKSLCSRVLVFKNGKLVADKDVNRGVSDYLQDKGESATTKTWRKNAPHNSTIQLERVRFVDSEGNKIEKVHTDQVLGVEIVYKVIKEGSSGGMTLSLYDEVNRLVFSSINNRDEKFHNKKLSKGRYQSTCYISQNLLNNGLFTVGINLYSKNYLDQVMVGDILRIEILDGKSTRGDYLGIFKGIVRPDLKWSNTKI